VKENKTLKQKLSDITSSTDEKATPAVGTLPTHLALENDLLKKRLKREMENTQKHSKMVEELEAATRVCACVRVCVACVRACVLRAFFAHPQINFPFLPLSVCLKMKIFNVLCVGRNTKYKEVFFLYGTVW
jgi:hypothetical protein